MTRPHRRTATGNALALSACLLMTWMAFVCPAASGMDAAPAASRYFDLPAQPLDAALVAFGEATGYSVLVSSELAAGRMAAPVRGDYTPAEALQRLLAGTQLGVRFSGRNAFTLLALADDIEELKNICTCGKKATMNIRVDEQGRRIKEGEQISIGGNESYRQACGRCFYS